jgi:hypothetical protein
VAQRGGDDGGSGEAWGRDSNVLGRSRARGRVRPTAEVEAEGGSGCQRAEENCEWEGAEGARLVTWTGKGRTRGDARRTADGRRTKNSDVGWTVEIEGRQNGRLLVPS